VTLSQSVCRCALGLASAPEPGEGNFEQLYQEGLHGLYARQLAPKLPAMLGKFQIEFGHGGRIVGQLQELDDALHGLEVVVFKGASFYPAVYPALGTRPVSDLDVWVRAGDLPRLEQALVSLRYQRLPGLGINYHRQGLAVVVHMNPVHQFRRVFPLSPAWWDSRRPLETLHSIRQLPFEEAYLVTALHGLKHAFRRLLWLLDVALLRQLACPERTAVLARQLGCVRLLQVCDALIQDMFYAQPLDARQWTAWELQFMRGVLTRRAPESAGMLVPLWSEAPWWRKVHYAAEAAYAEGANGWSRAERLLEILRKLWGWTSSRV